MANKTTAEIIQSMVDYINEYNRVNGKKVDVRQGTVYKDIVVDTPSQALGATYPAIEYAGKMSGINYASELSESDLNLLGANVSLPRKTQTYSVGFCDFITSATEANPPTENITIIAGTVVKSPATTDSVEISYQTTITNSILVSNLNNYKFTDTDGVNRYKVTIPIIAVSPGSDGNVASFTITQLTSPVNGIVKTRNTDPTTGGTDLETNASYGARIQAKMAGNNIGTVSGIKSLILADSRVSNVSLVMPGDSEMKRNQFGGSVDIYVLGEDLQQGEDVLTYVSGSTMKLTKLPVMGLTSVTAPVSGTSHSFEIGTEVELVKDTSILSDTVKELSYIRFIGVIRPDPGTVTVGLTYDKLTVDLQNLIGLDENHIVASDLLIRRSYKQMVNIEMTVSIFSGYIPNDVATAINTALVSTIDQYDLNDNLNLSDIIALADNVAGVNSVTLTTPTASVIAGKMGYLRVGTTTIRIGTSTFVF